MLEPLKLWYMRDNHTFVALPLDPDAAAEKIRLVLKEELGRCGMLCSHQYKEHVHHDWTDTDERFVEETRQWVRDALEADPKRFDTEEAKECQELARLIAKYGSPA